MSQLFSLDGKNILVTGASSGIGRAIAIACSMMNANVFAVGRDKKRLDDTLSQLKPGQHKGLLCELTDDAQVTEMVGTLPKLDGVVHSAGIAHTKVGKFVERSEAEHVMDVNFISPILLQAKLLQNRLMKKGSSIVFIASFTANAGMVGNGIYSASKGALISYANCLKCELAPKLIRVNCISPAMVKTKLINLDSIENDQLVKDEQTYLFKRYGTPDDIAGLALYLMSDASCWMTGNNIEMTGGAPRT